MQIIPAIDLKDNKCVRLSKGKDETSIIFNDDPEKQAIYFEEIGCKKLHIVDLDAAFGRPDVSLPSILKIRKSIKIPIQLGGGIRSKTEIQKYFDLGIDNLIIGSMSVSQSENVKQISNIYKKKIYVSLDIKGNDIMVKGWLEKSKFGIEDLLDHYDDSDIKGYIITDIENDGMLKGLNINFLKNIIKKIESYNNKNKKIIIAGGLTDYQDLKNLKKLECNNLEGIISGKSFYVGNIDLEKAQSILSSNG